MNPWLYGNPQIVFAIWVGIGVTLASLILFIAILVIRQVGKQREQNHLRAVALWRKVLIDAMQSPPAEVPALTSKDMSGFVEVWNELHETPVGTDNPGMLQVASLVNLAPKLEKMTASGSFSHRVMAVVALGHLRSTSSFDRLAGLINDRSPIVSITAARALMRINAERAVQRVVPQIVERHDWVDGGIAQMLNEAEPETVKNELGAATLRANDEVAPRLVRFLAGVSPDAAAPVIRKLLAETHDEHLVSTCLQVMVDANDLDKVRPLLHHERWHVRMHAAAALGRLGKESDTSVLMPLLADTQWWVRYRTAQAVQHLFGNDASRLEQVRDSREDKYARDILTQVIAERALGDAS
ncbi:MAG: HEAT repeat domain-containing protein [Thermomonas sp.]|uniref:HEAT repeat domain-containing protein n=1 Tax=Thermomonas sp. TaxID=1971895 RepID=UPI001ED5FA2A|nr:HEAT repeat domain-containing protein [Thermomonas sp.]MBV2209675.1 HEAT repeat domain-containing protein [Thermomonas sp.]